MQDTVELGLLALIVALLLRRQSSNLPVFGRQSRKIVLDSCALIDGRILDIVKTGFIDSQLVIPEFILRELQLLADGSDAHKRERARFGLDTARQLQEAMGERAVIDHSNLKSTIPTDDKLVLLAKKLRAQLYTTDFNLSKVAVLEGVAVLNVNELAQHLRPALLPGERVKLKIVQKGSNRGQGVGYLDDGTMVVVDNAERLIGTMVQVTIGRMHQTIAGKMAFAAMSNPKSRRSAQE